MWLYWCIVLLEGFCLFQPRVSFLLSSLLLPILSKKVVSNTLDGYWREEREICVEEGGGWRWLSYTHLLHSLLEFTVPFFSKCLLSAYWMPRSSCWRLGCSEQNTVLVLTSLQSGWFPGVVLNTFHLWKALHPVCCGLTLLSRSAAFSSFFLNLGNTNTASPGSSLASPELLSSSWRRYFHCAVWPHQASVLGRIKRLFPQDPCHLISI